jgi:phospholipase C
MTDIRHVVVLMLENRSFDSMLGFLYPKSDDFDGLVGTESNAWTDADGKLETVSVWNDPHLTAASVCTPDPDPGEAFSDIDMQIHGVAPNPSPMSGFVANYMQQPITDKFPDPRAVMHVFKPDQVPIISTLAKAFAVSDRWHASAPCQTWPNRFFAHAASAGGKVNNTPDHLFEMPNVFNLLWDANKSWRVYFHDIPQCAALTRLWPYLPTHFSLFDDFLSDAKAGNLPAYSFIEPRYFADTVLNLVPNDEHPPHNVAYGEELVAGVYNAVRQGPGWNNTLLLITYDEHGGCYDHVPPPAATPPGGEPLDGFAFDSFGVRVPAVIVSPYIKPGSVLRPSGPTPFDHTSIIATLRDAFGIGSLTPRDAAAPSLLPFLTESPDNAGPTRLDAPAPPPTVAQVATSAAGPQNNLQRSLSHIAVRLPAAAAQLGAHLANLKITPPRPPVLASVADAAAIVASRMRDILGPI